MLEYPIEVYWNMDLGFDEERQRGCLTLICELTSRNM